MKYMLAIVEDYAEYPGGVEGEAFRKICEAHGAIVEEMIKAGVFVHGAGLLGPDVATTVRITKGKRSVHDGPFAESKEQLGGFYVLDVPDLDAAIAWAKRLPTYADAAIEIRPTLPDEM
ncbi:MAG: YciI family protein [Parvularculaceae bacterium]|nr:YciI family protein [Parvularculaceae bacterium]